MSDVGQRFRRKAKSHARMARIVPPMAKGHALPSPIRPMGAARTAEPMVEMAAMTEAALPAIWPKGCIAMAFTLPVTKLIWPKVNDTQNRKKKNSIWGGMLAVNATPSARQLRICKNSMVTTMRRIPKRPTRAEFNRLALADTQAIKANHRWKFSASP